MSRPGHAYSDPVAQPAAPVPAAADEGGISPRFPLALAGVAIFASIRLLALGVSAFLLPRGKFHNLHYSLWHLIASWDSGRFLHIAAHGYSYVPGNLRLDVIFAWFPGYPAAIDTLSWIPGVGADGGSLVWTMLYSEALFCALAVWSLVALVERRWLTAAGLTILAGTVRSAAIALIAAVAVAALPPVIRAVRAREPIGAWWRPAAAVVTAPIGLVGYWAYSAWATHHLGGFAWVEENAHNNFDWGQGIILAAKQAIIYGPNASVALTLLVIAAAVILTAWSLAERIPVYLHAYTLVVVVVALAPGPYFLGSKPRFLLPAMLLGLPLARLMARARIWVLIPLIAVLAAASTWFGIYLMTTGWAP